MEEKIKTVVGILEKSPHPDGRTGPWEKQDWCQQCLLAKQFAGQPGVQIWICSETKVGDNPYATQYYVEACKKLGFEILYAWMGCETIGHLLAYQAIADHRRANLKLIVTKTHMKRVKDICDWYKIPVEEFIEADGIPRPSEAKTDAILEKLFPWLHRFRLLGLFRKYTIWRRKQGKL